VWRGNAYKVVEEGHPADPIDSTSSTTVTTAGTSTTGSTSTAPEAGEAAAAAPAQESADATPWWLFVTGISTLTAGLLTVALLLRRRHT